jgi:hypothetical protein
LILLRDREDLKGIDMTLPRGGAITGSLVDEFGDVVEGVQMRALELRPQDQRTLAVSAATALTDDRGYYRLFGLMPGRFLVVAAAAQDPADAKTRRGYAPVYFPGTPEIAAAREVTVDPEREHPWVDFARVPTRVQTVTGTAVDSKNDCVTDRVILVPSQRSRATIAETQGAPANGADCGFTIANVPPGDYVAQAQSHRDAQMPPEFGMAYVTVNEADPLSIAIKTRPGTTITGKLIQDGGSLDTQAFALAAVPVDYDNTSVLAPAEAMAVAANGDLRADGLNGTRRFTLTAAPEGWYLKSVKLRARDLTDSTLDLRFGAPPGDLEVVVSNRGASLSGSAMNGQQRQPDFSVLLFSTDRSQWFQYSRRVKAGRANGRGEFQIDGIPTGEYWVVAVDPLDGTATGLWQNRDALDSLVPVAQRIRLTAGESQTTTLRVSHR